MLVKGGPGVTTYLRRMHLLWHRKYNQTSHLLTLIWEDIYVASVGSVQLNILRPKLNGRHCTNDTFKCFFLNENIWFWIEMSLNLIHKGSFNSIPALVWIMGCGRPGHRPLSEPIMSCFTDAYMRHSASMSLPVNDMLLQRPSYVGGIGGIERWWS